MSKKILIVDDSPAVRQQLHAALSEAGFLVLQACDGREGQSLLESTPDTALVITDLNMPHMNGLELLSAIKHNPRNAELPVIMLTTENQSQLIAQARESGLKGWIVKPFKIDFLVAAVKKLTASPPV